MKNKILNLIVRGSSLFGKLVLLIYLSVYESTAIVGLYGLVVSVFLYVLFFSSFDLYVYANKELISADSESKRNAILTEQVAVGLVSLTIILLFLSLFVDLISISTVALIILVPLFYSEYLNQEIFRILVVFDRQIDASLNLLIRTAGWIPFLIIILSYYDYSAIDAILFLWLIGSLVSLSISITKIKKIGLKVKISKSLFKFDLLKRGFKKTSVFFIGTLAIKSISVIDKIFIEHFSGLSVVGVYVLYQNIGNAFMTLVDSTILSYSLPKVLKLGKKESISKYIKGVERNVTIAVLLFMILFIVITNLLKWLSSENEYVFSLCFTYMTIVGCMLTIITLPVQQALYALSCYKEIAFSKIIALKIFFLFLLFFQAFPIIPNHLFIPVSFMMSSLSFYFISKKIFMLKVS